MENKRQIVVILGMHRSGTSLAANFLNEVGVDLGQDLIPADRGNEAGYFESRTIYQIHDEILKELNCLWHNPPLSLPADWPHMPGIQPLRSALAEFVRSECSTSDKIWGFKDPRTAILLPMWREIFDELQLEPLYLLAVRNPRSVAASLARLHGLSSSRSQALWLKTNLDALSYTRNHPLAIADYDLWFHSGLEQARAVMNSLNLSRYVNETQIAQAANRAIRPGLRHHSITDTQDRLPDEAKRHCAVEKAGRLYLDACHAEDDTPWSQTVERFYCLLRQAAADGKIPQGIEDITTTFEKSRDLLNAWNGLVTERDTIIAERESTIEQCNTKIAQLRHQRKLLVYAIISVIAILSLIYSFMLFGSH